MKILGKMRKAVITTAMAASAAFVFAETTNITILETSDLHGAIYPFNYSTNEAKENGLAKAASVIKAERSKDPSLILVDCGDNMQDNFIQEFRFDKKNPMVASFNALGYDMHVLGNHEFNFEFASFENILKQYGAPVIACNVYKDDGSRYFEPWLIKEVNGVKVGLIGIFAPHIDRWESSTPDHFRGMTFGNPMEELGKVLPEIEGKADVLVVVAHYGLEGEYGTTGMDKVADVYGDKVSAFLIGHAHSVINQKSSSGAVILEPGSKGEYVSKVTITVSNDNDEGKWVVTDKKGENLSVKGIEADGDILKIAKKANDKSLKLANKVVGKVNADMISEVWWNGLEGIPSAKVEDTALVDLINTVQMHCTGATVSQASLFVENTNLTKGKFIAGDTLKVYKYPNNILYSVKITGAQLKEIMEIYAGDYFNQYKEGDVTISFNENIRGYNYDMFAGVDYEINIANPKGSRIENIMYQGAPLKDDEEILFALNDYRFKALVADGIISNDPANYTDTATSVCDFITDYVKAQKKGLDAECDHNWKITGFNPDPSQAEKVYAKVKSGEIKVPTSENGRTTNVKALNYYELKEQGLVD